MIELYLVMSMWHSRMRDYTFVHGVFDEITEAEKVQADVINDMSFVERELRVPRSYLIRFTVTLPLVRGRNSAGADVFAIVGRVL